MNAVVKLYSAAFEQWRTLAISAPLRTWSKIWRKLGLTSWEVPDEDPLA
jgi:hypothetical protein